MVGCSGTMANEDKEILNRIIGSYSVEANGLEDENKMLQQTVINLRSELSRAQKQLDMFQKPPLLVAEVREMLDENVLVRLNNGNEFFVEKGPDCPKLKSDDAVLVEQKNLTVLKKIPGRKKFNIEKFVIIDKPTVSWDDVGGLDNQAEEIREVIELPLLKPALFKKVGIHPPKGILLYGTPGTGKTLLAKAVASSTNSTFIELVGSELVQKFIGEGAKLVKEVFDLAREKAPSIIFIDEIDALAATRIEIGTSGEREVQRTFMQLLAEIDGFKSLDNVKIIGCTNRKDILDPAVTRPGRLDRLIKVPNPDKDGIIKIFSIHTRDMTVDKKANLDKIYRELEGYSGAEIKAVCTEAGYFAIRANRTKVTGKDFLEAVVKVKREEEEEGEDFMRMFG